MLVRTRVVLTTAVLLALVALTVAPAGAASWHFENLDGGGGPSGRVDSDVGQYSSTVLFNTGPHTFYRDAAKGTLRHAWWDGVRWGYETLDGDKNTATGRKEADVGTDVKAIIYRGTPHVFYYDVTNGDLRHTWWDGVQWGYETLDGNRTLDGRINGDVGTDLSVMNFGTGPHLFYYDASHGDLRHSWWDGVRWGFETLDGNRTLDNRVDADVGQWNATVLYGQGPHLFYYNDTAATLRHAWWDGVRWGFETLDGLGGPTPGVSVDSVGSDVSAIIYNGAPHLFYYDITDGDLRHSWWDGVRWGYETLDGDRTLDNRVDADVGTYTSVILYNSRPLIFYGGGSGQQDLRHAWWDGVRWGFGTLDGSPGSLSARSGEVGSDGSSLIYAGQPHIWYYDAGSGNLLHAYFA